MGSLDSVLRNRYLATRLLFMLLPVLTGQNMHRRKDRLPNHAILCCVLLHHEVQMGATSVRLLLEAFYGVWSYASLALEAFSRDGILSHPLIVTPPAICTILL